jgi:rod shape-determining protein MreC
MGQLFEFIVRNRNFILFILLEVFSFWLIVNNNNYWSVEYFNTANALSAKVLTTSNAVREYANLRDVNTSLAEENRQLREMLTVLQQKDPTKAPVGYQPDSTFAARYKFVTIAKVIENTTQRADNYLTLDKGTADGVRVGMGVIAPSGVVGKVKICNEHFSIVTSILHSQFMVSSKLIRSGEIGTIKWETTNPAMVQLKDVSRYKKVMKGDTVVTSDQNAVFPAGVKIGEVQRITISTDQAFFDIDVALGTDFTKISYVYLVDNKLQSQQQSLEESLIEKKKK